MRRLGITLTALIAVGTISAACSSDTGVEDGGLGGGGPGTGGKSIVTGGTGAAGGMAGAGATGSGGTRPLGTGGAIPTSGGATGTGATSGAGGSGGGCVGSKATSQKGESAVLLLLVDTSLSMDTEAPGGEPGPGQDPSRLDETKVALNAAIAELPDGISVGLIFYPQVPICNTGGGPQPGAGGMSAGGSSGAPAPACDCFNENTAVPIAPLNAAQRMALSDAVNDVEADGSTPTHDAYKYALEQLQATTQEGQKYIVLITDGEPTFSLGCVGTGMPPSVDTQPIIDESTAAFGNMVKTFVIGSPGSDPARGSLSAIARVGGTGADGCSDTGTPEYCHFDMTMSDDLSGGLTEVLGEIRAQIPVDCNFEIPPPPNSQDTIDTSKVNVVLDGMTVPYDQSCTAASAWRFDDPVAPTEVVFCGTLCDTVKASNMSTVELQFDCVRIDVPR